MEPVSLKKRSPRCFVCNRKSKYALCKVCYVKVSLEKAAIDYANREGGAPTDLFVGGYGWVIRHGKKTAAGKKFAEDQLKKEAP